MIDEAAETIRDSAAVALSNALREVIAEELRNDARDPLPTAEQFAGVLARAIGEKLGITEDMVARLRAIQRDSMLLSWDEEAGDIGRAADALATLLEAGRTDD